MQLSTLLMEVLRERKVSDPYALSGAWELLGDLLQTRPQVVNHVLDLGLLELAMAELHTASSMDWVSIAQDPSGHFGRVLYALEQVVCAPPRDS